MENRLEMEMVQNGVEVFINGSADYAAWYDQKGMWTGLVIVEAKHDVSGGPGVGQCLAYMGEISSKSLFFTD